MSWANSLCERPIFSRAIFTSGVATTNLRDGLALPLEMAFASFNLETAVDRYDIPETPRQY